MTDATYDKKSGEWEVKVWWGPPGEIATGKVVDGSGLVLEAWTGPQVAWKMARGYSGAFGGTVINNTWVWLGFCAVFLVGLGNIRRPLSWRNLDLIALLFFSVSLWYFNEGDIFTSVPLAYPPMFYLVGRLIWIGSRKSAGSAFRPIWPVWLLAAATVFLLGFRIGINVEAPRSVIDVGYSGVIGADRISSGQSPYGHMPIEDSLKPCGKADSSGEIRERIQTNGRCESANERGDTYGPAAYEAYLPAVRSSAGAEVGQPARRARDLDHLGRPLPDRARARRAALRRLAAGRHARLRLGRLSVHRVRARLEHERRDHARVPDLGLLARQLTVGARRLLRARRLDEVRRAAGGAALALVPGGAEAPAGEGLLPDRVRRRHARGLLRPVHGAEPAPRRAGLLGSHARLADRARVALLPLGLEAVPRRRHPEPARVQWVLEGLLAIGSIAVYFFPKRKGPLQLAALTGAILLGFELVLTHWFYLYIPWFFPFAAIALLAAPAREAVTVEDAVPREHTPRTLVPAG